MANQDVTRSSSEPTRPRRRIALPPAAAQSGQIIIMFAFFATAMLGVLGLATDLGYNFVSRRNSQNAADAGALAGALAVFRETAADATVAATVAENTMTAATLDVTFCGYVNDDGPHTNLGSCDDAPPSGATGVHVHVAASHDTFFMRLFGVDTSSTTAEATANVQIWTNPPADGPFLVCGVNTKIDGNGNNHFDILKKVSGEWQFNPNADGRWFEVHGPQTEDCDAKAERYKGVANQEANRGKTTPAWFEYTEGDTAGPVVQDVEGPGGCKAGQTTDCIMILPIAVDDPAETDNDRGMYTVGWGAFYVEESSPSGNSHRGKFIYRYSVKGGGKPGWTPGDSGGVTTIRLTQ